MGDELAVVAALREELRGVRLLEVAAPDLARGNLRGDRQDRYTAAVAVVEAVDQVQVARAAAAGAHGQLAREVGFCPGGKRSHFLVPHVGPFQLLRLPDGVGDAVERVAGHAVDPAYACFRENVDQLCSYRFLRHGPLSPPPAPADASIAPSRGRSA